MNRLFIFCCCLLLSQIGQAQVPTNGLVAEYLFANGSYDDTNPNGQGPNHANAPAAVVNATDRFGNPDYAKYLAGVHAYAAGATYITLGTSNVLKPREGTISIWVNMNQISNSGWGYSFNPIIIATNTRSPGAYMEAYSLYVVMTNRQLLTLMTNPNPIQQTIFYKGYIPDDTWHHYVMTYDDDTMKSYIDGVLLQAEPKGYNSQGTFSNEQVRVGSSMNPTYNRALDGTVDDIRIYNRVLNQSEVLSLYHEANPIATPIYAELKEQLDAGFYPMSLGSNQVYFYYKEAYKTGTLDYKVYDQSMGLVSTTLENVDLSNTPTKRYGTNRFRLTVPSMNAGQFYLLEVTNEKGEKEYLRFSQI